MKLYITSYNVVRQNASGGIQVRINNLLQSINHSVDIKLFDMWNDNLSDCDILHVFKANIDSYALMVHAKEKGKKIVLSSVVPQDRPCVVLFNLILSKLFRLQTGYSIIKKELLMSDCIIAQTEKERSFIAKYYKTPKSKIEVVPNGISIHFDEANRYALKELYPIGEKFLLQVGRFDENKNQLSVIKALKGTGIKVLFIGGPDPQSVSYYDHCRTVADDNFTFLGWLPNDSPELQSAYMNAHAVILPSHKEIFGNSIIEAGAAGAKLIVSNALPVDSMGIKEYCDVIDPGDIIDIKNKVITVMNTEKQEGQMQLFFSLFSWAAVAKRHLDIYNRVLKNDC